MKVRVKHKLNRIPHLNDFLDDRNREMKVGDQLECVAITSQQEFHVIRMRFPRPLGSIIVALDYIWNEMFPKRLFTASSIVFAGIISAKIARVGHICNALFQTMLW